jgi:hypothetical protein
MRDSITTDVDAKEHRQPDKVVNGTPPSVRVFVAVSPLQGRNNRDALLRYLDGNPRVTILPAAAAHLWPDLQSMEAFESEAERLLRGAKLFVQLLGTPIADTEATEPNRFATAARDLPAALISLQLQIAERLRVKPLLWCSPDLEDAAIEPVEADIRRSRSVVEDSFETFKRLLDAQIGRFHRAMTVEARPASDNPVRVFMNFSKEDRQLAEPFTNRYESRYTIFRPAEGDSPAETRELNDEFYRICDAAVFFDWAAPSRWMDAQLTQFSKVRTSRAAPIRALAAVRSDSRPKPTVSIPDLRLIDTAQMSNPALITSVLDQLLANIA